MPSQPLTRSGGIRPSDRDVGGSEQSGVDDRVVAPLEPGARESCFGKLLEAVRLARCYHVVARRVLLKHHPHRFDVFRRPAPIAHDRGVAQVKLLIASGGDTARGGDDLPGDESLRTKRRLVVEEDSRASEQAVSLTVVRYFPERGGFGDRVRTARPKRRLLIGGFRFCVAEAFTRARVVQLDGPRREANRFQQVQRSLCDAFKCFDRLLKRKPDRTLPGQVIDFIRFDLHQRLEHASKVYKRNRLDRDAVSHAK